jgi:hypothetical protein
MALRPVRGVLATEATQTGDSRVIVAGALEWPDPPLPLAWLERQMHGDLLDGGTQIGTIQTITRTGDDIAFTGEVDDAIPEGAELLRRLGEGSAPLGNRVGISIDPDNWAVEVVDTTMDESDAEEMVMLLASGSGPLPRRRSRPRPAMATVAASGPRDPLLAAAGDPDPGEGVGVVLFTDAAGDILERYTRLRIRGATACAIAAFISGWMELNGEAAEAEPAPEGETVTAAALVRTSTAPPRFAFELPEPEPGMHDDGDLYGMPVQELLVEQPDGGLAVPVSFAERDWGWQVFGHAARWGQCHVGYLDECVTAPPSNAAYAHYHVGEVECADGSRVSTGTLSANCDHAAAHLLAPEARDHYAHSGLAFADVRASNGALGVWISGALRPSITENQLRVLRASSLSGDWRRIGADLEFIAALAVNTAGFPIAREYVMASGMTMPRASLAASAHVDDGRVMSLVASGVVQRCPDCQRRAMRAGRVEAADTRMDEALSLLRALDLRTRHLRPDAVQYALESVQRFNGNGDTDMARTPTQRVLPPRRRG